MIEQLERGQTYHIYNRGNNRENLFREQRNYTHFLNLYRQHIVPIAHTYAYCLLKNHFHLLVTIKTTEEITSDPTGFQNLSGLEIDKLRNRPPSRAFANFFNAYTKSINRAYARTGALFERPFQRRPVQSDKHFHRLIIYIHQNPQRHGFVDDFRTWPYTSYNAIITDRPTQIARQPIHDYFGSVDTFIQQHNELIDNEELNNPYLTGF